MLRLHELLRRDAWNQVEYYIWQQRHTVTARLQEPHKGEGGSAIHAVSHRPAPAWLQEKIFDIVIQTDPSVTNEKAGHAQATQTKANTNVNQMQCTWCSIILSAEGPGILPYIDT